jgi:prophage regulatory protein
MKKKKPSAAARARAAFDPDPPEPFSDIPLPDRQSIIERARPPPPRLLSRREVLERVGATYPSVWKWMRDGKFPRARELTNGRIAWLESEIEEWIANLPIRKLKGDE